MHISEFQSLMKQKLGDKDKQMGSAFLLNILVEEVGELAKALRKQTKKEITEEIADVIFTSMSIANILDIQIESALKEKYVDRTLFEISKKWSDVTWK